MIYIKLSKRLSQKLKNQINVRVHITEYDIHQTKQTLKSIAREPNKCSSSHNRVWCTLD